MTVDPAVRSVRVAVVLSERFAEILKGPDTVSSRKQSGALVGFSGDQSEMSLRIGEAQQIYPEIWQHLDDARKAFAARGIEVSAYDAIRTAEGKGIGAAVEVRATVHGVGRHSFEEQVKSANFNRAGLARAKQAIAALVAATPQIDWVAIAKAESEDPDVLAFGRSARIKRWVSIGLLVVVIASPFVYLIRKHLKGVEHYTPPAAQPIEPAAPISDEERATITTMVTALRGKLAAARASWPKAVAPEALAAIVPGTEPCPLPFDAPTDRGAERFIRDGIADEVGTGTFATYSANALISEDQLANMSAIVGSVEQHVAANRLGRSDRTRLGGIAPYFVFLVIDREVETSITSTAPTIAFTPGEIIGRAYVFSVETAKIVCAAKIDVRNAVPSTVLDKVRRKPEAAEVLHRELEVRLRQALATGLRANQ